jgi:transposase-like protein
VRGKKRVFSVEFKEGVVQRMGNGESVTALGHEYQIRRSVLYRWRDAYRKEGTAGLRSRGRLPGMAHVPRLAGSPQEAAARRMAELERKIGQQALDLDFLRRAFKRVKESRRGNAATGGTASTERSGA